MTLKREDVLVPCTKCSGRGKTDDGKTCRSCDGRGQRLSEAGQAIRAVVLFLKKNGELS